MTCCSCWPEFAVHFQAPVHWDRAGSYHKCHKHSLTVRLFHRDSSMRLWVQSITLGFGSIILAAALPFTGCGQAPPPVAAAPPVAAPPAAPPVAASAPVAREPAAAPLVVEVTPAAGIVPPGDTQSPSAVVVDP